MTMASMVRDTNRHVAMGDFTAPVPTLSSAGSLLGARAQVGVCW